jgi:hypothetical protein
VAAQLSQVQRRLPAVIQSVDGRAMPQKGLGRRLVSISRSQMKRRVAILVSHVRGDAAFKKRLDRRSLPAFRRVEEALSIGLLRPAQRRACNEDRQDCCRSTTTVDHVRSPRLRAEGGRLT